MRSLANSPSARTSSSPGLSLSPGRPKLATMFEGAISKTVQLGAGVKDEQGHSGMLVSVCGPTSLADDVAKKLERSILCGEIKLVV